MSGAGKTVQEGVTLDPVTLAVLKGRLEQIADEMDATLYRSAFNPIIAEDGGGLSSSGQQTIMVDKSLLTSFANSPNGEPPVNVTPTVVLGISAFVLSVNNKLGVLYITTGFPT